MQRLRSVLEAKGVPTVRIAETITTITREVSGPVAELESDQPRPRSTWHAELIKPVELGQGEPASLQLE